MRSMITIPVAAISLFALVGCERWGLDRKMEELCKKDGGLHVYEKVILPAHEFETLRKLAMRAKPEEDYFGPNYRYLSKREVLVGKNKAGTGAGQLVRLHWAIYRRSDDRLLGEQVEYRRSGGDLFTFGFQPSNASCPHIDRDVAQMIFIKGE
jgi:hypothetical protein